MKTTLNFGTHFERYTQLRLAAKINVRTLDQEAYRHRLFWNFLGERNWEIQDELEVTSACIRAYAEHVMQLKELKLTIAS